MTDQYLPGESDDPIARMPDRARALDTAAEYVLRQRNKSYGEPDEDFQRIAAVASALGFRFNNRQLTGSDVSLFMVCLKLSRLAWSPTHEDSWIDVAGYAACGMETANLEALRSQASSAEIADEVGAIIGATLSPERKRNPNVVKALTARERQAAVLAGIGDPSDLEKLGLMLVSVDIEPERPCHKCGSPNLPEGHHTFDGLCVWRVAYRRNDG